MSNDNQTNIHVDDIIKIYKRGKIEVVALRGLSCRFNKGEITVIMGPSGCGKTTLLNIIGGLDRINSGKILVNEIDLAQLSDKELEIYRRNNIGFVFQFMNLIPELNAHENITLPLELSGTYNNETKTFVDELLDIVGLKDRQTHRPDELSGGEQQRISIAAALANDPEIILCDEPTGELDSLSKKVIMDLLRSVIDKFPEKTMIIVSHDPDLKSIADQMYYIKDGNISHHFSKEELTNQQKFKHDSNDGKTYMPTNKDEIDRQVLLELREIQHIVGTKIKNIEKKHHPI